MTTLLRYCDARADWLAETILALVAAESPSTDKTAADVCAGLLATLIVSAGGRVEVVPRHTVGDIVMGHFGSGPRHVLILGHYDTVWPVGEAVRQRPRREGGCLYGPGVYDMKSGLAVALLALRALAAGPGFGGRVTLLITSDEETGSAESRALIETCARGAEAVLVLEPSLPDGSVKTARKGCGQYVLRLHGVAAHAGVEPERGASAIHELARIVSAVVALGDPARGLTVNVGTVRGGSRANVVAEYAEADVDVRAVTLADGRWFDAAIRALSSADPRVRLDVAGGIDRPPLERSAGVAALYAIARRVAAEFGTDLGEGATGGGSDGNFTAAIGVPTLDGLGPLGAGAHAVGERVDEAALPARAALVAGLLAEILGR